MNRAARRRADKAAKKESEKKVNNNRIILTRQELDDIKTQARTEAATALVPCLALAEHRVHGFGKKRALRTLNYLDILMTGYINGSKSPADYIQECEDELGIHIKYRIK